MMFRLLALFTTLFSLFSTALVEAQILNDNVHIVTPGGTYQASGKPKIYHIPSEDRYELVYPTTSGQTIALTFPNHKDAESLRLLIERERTRMHLEFSSNPAPTTERLRSETLTFRAIDHSLSYTYSEGIEIMREKEDEAGYWAAVRHEITQVRELNPKAPPSKELAPPAAAPLVAVEREEIDTSWGPKLQELSEIIDRIEPFSQPERFEFLRATQDLSSRERLDTIGSRENPATLKYDSAAIVLFGPLGTNDTGFFRRSKKGAPGSVEDLFQSIARGMPEGESERRELAEALANTLDHLETKIRHSDDDDNRFYEKIGESVMGLMYRTEATTPETLTQARGFVDAVAGSTGALNAPVRNLVNLELQLLERDPTYRQAAWNRNETSALLESLENEGRFTTLPEDIAVDDYFWTYRYDERIPDFVTVNRVKVSSDVAPTMIERLRALEPITKLLAYAPMDPVNRRNIAGYVAYKLRQAQESLPEGGTRQEHRMLIDEAGIWPLRGAGGARATAEILVELNEDWAEPIILGQIQDKIRRSVEEDESHWETEFDMGEFIDTFVAYLLTRNPSGFWYDDRMEEYYRPILMTALSSGVEVSEQTQERILTLRDPEITLAMLLNLESRGEEERLEQILKDPRFMYIVSEEDMVAVFNKKLEAIYDQLSDEQILSSAEDRTSPDPRISNLHSLIDRIEGPSDPSPNDSGLGQVGTGGRVDTGTSQANPGN